MKKLILLLLLIGLSTDLDARIRVKFVYPTNGNLKIKNVAGFAYDYTHFMLSVNGSYFHLSNLTTVQGNLNAGINEEIEFSGLTLPASASIGLWYPSSLPGNATASNLVDFMQYGSAGNNYESVAVSAGLWTAGEFVSGPPPYMHVGGASDEGASFWQNSTMGIDHFNGQLAIETFPNPIGEKFTLSLDGPEHYGNLSLSIIDMNGQILKKLEIQKNRTEISSDKMASGVYLLLLRSETAIIERKYVIKR